jgi:hypothetical protein
MINNGSTASRNDGTMNNPDVMINNLNTYIYPGFIPTFIWFMVANGGTAATLACGIVRFSNRIYERYHRQGWLQFHRSPP